MFRKRLPKAGARPGTLVIPESAPPTRIHLARIEDGAVQERDIADWTELREETEKGRLAWIDVQGLGNEEAIRGIGELFSIHPLAMEDIVNVPQRPKAELYEDQWVLTTRMVRFDDEGKLVTEQVSVVFGEWLRADCSRTLRRRLRSDSPADSQSQGPDAAVRGELSGIRPFRYDHRRILPGPR